MEVIRELGLVQVYTGEGKGKTTAALGLALRASGHGFRVHIIQFMKGRGYAGELISAQKLLPQLSISQFGRSCDKSEEIKKGIKKCTACGNCFAKDRGTDRRDFELAGMALAEAISYITNNKCDILILDEIGNALRYKLVSSEQVLDIVKNKPKEMELILTGRGVPEEILAAADLVTEMKEIKHPFKKGIASRRGIEY